MDEFEKELKQAFFIEADQLLLNAEQAFLELEKFSGDLSIIEKIFRQIHSLKGSARAAGFDDIGTFTHEFESLLVKLKKGELAVSSQIITLLLRCNDHIRQMIATSRSDMTATTDSTELLGEIRQAAEHRPSDNASRSGSAPAHAAQDNAEITFLNPPEPVSASEPAQKAAETTAPQAASSTKEDGKASSEKKLVAVEAGQEESIRISLKRLEVLMNRIGELVILQTVLNQQKNTVDSLFVQKTIAQLGKITKNIQGISMGLRMIPLKPTFQKLQRTVRDASKSLSKDVQFTTVGDETEMDKNVIDQIMDPLTHLIRHTISRSLESVDERIALGKPTSGKVTVSASHSGNRILLEIQDDGRGLNVDEIRETALKRGLLRPGHYVTDKSVFEFIFHPGFYDSSDIDLAFVKAKVDQLQGEIRINTTPGKGTNYTVALPLTLSIIDAMVVRIENENYVMPLDHIYESVKPEPHDVHHVTGLGEVLNLRGESLPLFRLTDILERKHARKAASDCIALLVRTGSTPFSVLVDDIIGQQQVVIKTLGQELGHLNGFTGSAILGDGRAALILDVNDLIRKRAA